MIYLAEFCKCGSLVIAGRCSNKNCIFRAQDKPANEKAASTKRARASKAEKDPTKVTRTRRASKMVTYNLYEVEEKEGDN